MQTEMIERNGTCVYTITGDIDMYSAPELHHIYLGHAAQSRQIPLVIDLANVGYLDSSGIGVLVQILADTKKRKVDFCLCNVHGMVEKLLHLSRMNLILPSAINLEAALERARNS